MCACTEPVRTGIGAVCVEYSRPKWPTAMLNHASLVQKNVLFFIFGTLRMLVRPAMKRLFCLKAKNGLIIISKTGSKLCYHPSLNEGVVFLGSPVNPLTYVPRTLAIPNPVPNQPPRVRVRGHTYIYIIYNIYKIPLRSGEL